MNLGHSDRLKLIRNENNQLTQQQLADFIDIPLHKIKSIETNKAKISIEIALKIEEKFNFSFKWLLTGEGPIYKGEVSSSEDQNTLSKKTIKSDPEFLNSNITKVIIEHQDTIRRFKNPEKVKQFNEFLVEIEVDDPEGYDELYKEAKAIYKTIKRIKNKQDSKKTPKDREDIQDKSTA